MLKGGYFVGFCLIELDSSIYQKERECERERERVKRDRERYKERENKEVTGLNRGI